MRSVQKEICKQEKTTPEGCLLLLYRDSHLWELAHDTDDGDDEAAADESAQRLLVQVMMIHDGQGL